MSKVMFKTPYTKSGKGIAKGYVRYIATRDGVDKSINAKVGDINVRYIATRPGVIKLGEHGLFGQEDDINLDKAIKSVSEHKGKVWRPIISLRREDAARLGYDDPYTWRTLLRSMQLEFAKAYRIPIDDLVWYAAFHDEGHHPHIHMIVYNKNPGGEFITDVGWANIKESLTKNIFKDELKHLYDQRQTLRDKIIEEVMARVDIRGLDYGESDAEFIKCYNELKFSLDGYTGNRKYKYLSPEQKKKVDAVAKNVYKDDSIQNLYNQWCQLQLAILRIYKTNPQKYFDKLYENKAIKFYNGHLFYKDKDTYIDEAIVQPIEKMVEDIKDRMSEQMFKQSVEMAKLFWLTVKAYGVNGEVADVIHNDCVEEVKEINGAIRFPFYSKEGK